MAEDQKKKKSSIKGTFGRIFARTDIPIKVKQKPGQTMKTRNIVYVSGSKTFKAKADSAVQLNYSSSNISTLPNNNNNNKTGVNLDFHLPPEENGYMQTSTLPARATGSDVRNANAVGAQAGGSDRNNNEKRQNESPYTQTLPPGTAMSAKFIQSTQNPDVEYFRPERKEVETGESEKVSPRGRKLERRESERVWNAYRKDKNTYRHQYFIQKQKTLEDDEEVVALMNREPSPVRVDTSQPAGARPSPPRRQMSRQFSRQSVFDQISPVFQ